MATGTPVRLAAPRRSGRSCVQATEAAGQAEEVLSVEAGAPAQVKLTAPQVAMEMKIMVTPAQHPIWEGEAEPEAAGPKAPTVVQAAEEDTCPLAFRPAAAALQALAPVTEGTVLQSPPT